MTTNQGKPPPWSFPTLFGADEIEVPKETSPAEEEIPFLTVKQRYPRIADAIELMWGTREMEVYLGKLIMDERGGRAGFPQPVLAALLKLYKQHTSRFKYEQVEDKWSQDPMARHTDRFDTIKDKKT